jgi:L-ribulose-5-phosphate 4-epimerase
VPVTPPLETRDIEGDYESKTGEAIVRRFADLDAGRFSAVLVHGHAPFCWGPTPDKAAHTAVVLEEIARMAYYTVTLNAGAQPISQALRDKHFLRKHGSGRYYGQP